MFSGQPLLVISLSLPLSLLDGMLYSTCQKYGIDFLTFRMMIGIWAVIILAVFVAVNLSSYLKFFTRFALEIFVVVPALVLLGYGFAHMCYMIREYAALPGTFSNQTCQCLRTFIEPLNTSIAVTNDTGVFTTSLPSTIATTTLAAGNNTLNASTMATPLRNTSQMIYTATSTTTGTPAGFRLVKVVQHGIHFRDCQANGMSLEGGACMYGVYPFTSILTVSSIVLFFFLTSFQHLGYLPKQVQTSFSSLKVVLHRCKIKQLGNNRAIFCLFVLNTLYTIGRLL